jgi:hypothetical protein
MTLILHTLAAPPAVAGPVRCGPALGTALAAMAAAPLLTRRTAGCTDALLATLWSVPALGDRIDQPAPGRSVTLRIHGDRIRVKGLLGLSAEADGFVLVPPDPERRFRAQLEHHLHLDDDLRLDAKAGRPKFWYSLRADGAEREHDCQVRLAAAGVGPAPLAALRFRSIGGAPLRDGNGAETGAVILTWSGAATPLADEIHRAATWPAGRNPAIGSHAVEIDQARLREHLATICEIYRVVGRVRRVAALEAGVLRHAGHPENFVRNAGGVQVVDTDTCLLAEELSAAGRGALLLRDLSSDILRMIAVVSQLHWSSSWHDALAAGASPFRYYLAGFFEGLQPATAIDAVAAALDAAYLAWIGEYRAVLDALADAYVREWDGSAPHRSFAGSKWRRLHVFFAPAVLGAVYELLGTAGGPGARPWTLPTRPLVQLHLDWAEGANRFVRKAASLGSR